MSVVVPIKPVPPDDPAPEATTDADGWALLDGLRRRMDDQAAQNRKTGAQVSQLAESIAALVEVQRRRTRRLNLNSFVAYVLFTLLCGAGAYAMYWSRSHELVAARDAAIRERDAAVRRADEATQARAARDAAEAAHPAEVHVVSADEALKGAVVAFKAGRFGEVTGPLEAALANEPAGPRAATMHYYVGVVAAKAGELDKSIAQLQAAISGDVSEEDARFQLASALDRKGEYAKARAEYDRFSTAHPKAALSAYALRRSATLARMPATAPGLATAPAPTTGAPALATPPATGAPAVATPPAKGAPAVATPPAKGAPAVATPPAKTPAPKAAPAPAAAPPKAAAVPPAPSVTKPGAEPADPAPSE